MKEKISIDELETFRVSSFDYINNLKSRIRDLNIIIANLEYRKNELLSELIPLASDYDQIIASYRLRGDHYQTVLDPIKLKNELELLRASTYSMYSGLENKEQKAKYDALKSDYEAKIKEAEDRLKEYESYSKEVSEAYISKKKELNKVNSEIKGYKSEKKQKNEEINRTLSQIRKIDGLVNKGKSVSRNQLVLKKNDKKN